MIGTIAIVLLVLAVIIGGGFIYAKHKATINREAGRIVDQAEDLVEKVKDKVE